MRRKIHERLGWKLMGIPVPPTPNWSWRWTVYRVGVDLHNEGWRIWRWSRPWPEREKQSGN